MEDTENPQESAEIQTQSPWYSSDNVMYEIEYEPQDEEETVEDDSSYVDPAEIQEEVQAQNTPTATDDYTDDEDIMQGEETQGVVMKNFTEIVENLNFGYRVNLYLIGSSIIFCLVILIVLQAKTLSAIRKIKK